MRKSDELDKLKGLGSKVTQYADTYAPDVLECFENKNPDADYMVSLDAYEFTSLCPKTGQPDFAKIHINYVPDKRLVESKSLKLYLFSFRNTGDFHEDCVNIILNDLKKLLEPKYIEVEGIFTPRGGIAIYPFAAFGKKDTPFCEMAFSRMFSGLADRYKKGAH